MMRFGYNTQRREKIHADSFSSAHGFGKPVKLFDPFGSMED